MVYSIVDSSLYDLIMGGNRYVLPKGQMFDTFGDRKMVYLIEKGYVKRYLISKYGTKSVQSIYGPGDIFPLSPLLENIYNINIYNGSETYYHESITDVVVYAVDQSKVYELLEKNPSELYKELLFTSSIRLAYYIHSLEDQSLKGGIRRIAHQLAFFAERFGVKTEAGIEVNIPLTHQDLGDILNISRESVSREMSKLKNKGLIIGGKTLTIPDLAKLRAIYL